MKRLLQILSLLLLMSASALNAQNGVSNKITADLMSKIEESQNSNDLIRVIIMMSDQYDAPKTVHQMRYLDKSQKREFVINELKRISNNGQKAIVNTLKQEQKSNLVVDIQQYWIINAISCSMTKDMIYVIASRPDVKLMMSDIEIRIPDGEDEEVYEPNRDGEIQWNVAMVNADDVWNSGYTGNGVIVAVIDTGVNYNHTDISNNMWDGGTDYPHHGWDYCNNDNDPMDDHSHGTHCAGTVSSYGTNGQQCGIAKNAKIMALKVLAASGSGSTSNTMLAIQFAVDHGADVLSLSLGTDGSAGVESYRQLMENVLNCGVVASIAAGNTGNKYDDYGNLKYPVPYNVGSPGNIPSPWGNPDQTLTGGHAAVVTVGATTIDDEHSAFSSFGPVTWSNIGVYNDYPYTANSTTNIGLIKPDVSAPGSSIVSLYYGDNTGYSTKSGTSMATPCVAGVMALMLEANPMLTPVEIDSILEVTSVQLGGYTTKNNYFGAGRVDAQAAVAAAVSMIVPGEIVINPDTIDMGYRPNGAWMASQTIGLYNKGGAIEIQNVQISNPYFQIDLDGITFPYSIDYHETLPVKLTTGSSTNNGTPINAVLTVNYGDAQQTQAVVTAVPYIPSVKDVWEIAYQVNTFPFTDSLIASSIPLHNNYNLAPTGIEDGADAAYKLVFDQDVMLNASMTSGDDGKIALYTEGFMGVGGPDLDNNFISPLGLVDANRSSLLEELTVHDGSATNGYVPLYGFYTDAYLRMEMIYPASELSNMTGSDIQSMKFYANQTNVTWGNASFKVFLTEVSDVTINSFCGPAGTVVYEGALSIIDGEMNVTFTTPYTYNGGNLLVGMYSITTGSYVTSTWYGETVNGASLQGYSYSSVDAVSGTQRNFLPKTTFNYMLTNTINNMTVPHGTYYLVTSSTSDAWGIEINVGTLECPELASHPTPSDYNTNVIPTAVNLKWRMGDRTTEYKLLFGTDYDNLTTVVDWTRNLSESYLATGLLNNANYFWQVMERNDGCTAGVNGPIWGFTTMINGPENVYAWYRQLYEGDTLHLGWTPMADTNIVSYNIYQNNILIGNTTENEYSVSGLAYNMDGYNFQVSGVYAGGESNPINTVLVQVSGNGSVAGHVYEQDGLTPIQSARVTLAGNDEFGNYQSFTFVTDASGFYSGNLLAGTYQATSSCGGYQDITLSNSIIITYNNTTSGVDLMMDEYYFPVNSVTASYYPDANNSNSQYVKVEWSNDATGWLYYDNGTNYDAIGAGETQFYWGVKFDVSDYNNYSLTKVSMYDYATFEGEILIYQTEDTPSGTPLLQQSFTGNATNDFVEYTLNTPISVDPSLPLWIVMHRLSGDTYVASECLDQGDPNGRWISLDGEDWRDLGGYYGLYYTWMLRGYLTNAVRGERMLVNSAVQQHNIPDVVLDDVTITAAGDTQQHFVGTPMHIEQNGNRSFQYYRVYRTDYYNNGPFTDENTVLLADNLTETYYIDDTWMAAASGVYKYGVSCVYEGNRESPIRWNEQKPVYFGDDPNGPAPFVNVPEDSELPILRTEYSKAIVARWSHGNDFGSFILNNPSESYSLGFTNDVFTNGACTMNGTVYFSDFDGKFGIIDPNNGLNVIATDRPFTVIDDNPVDGKMYGCRYDGNLYEINPVDGSYTLLAQMPVSTLITFTITNDGRFIICDRGDETIKEYFPATGGMSTLFTMDWDIDYGQDMATDRETNEVYWAAYNNTDGTMPLIKIDLANNQMTTIGYFDGQVSAFAITDIHLLNVGRESRIVWSSAVDKNMYLTDGDVNINVTLNSGDSPEGVLVHFNNLNATEQQLYPISDVTLDATGQYAWDKFRRGNYRVTVSIADYVTVVEEVSIWDATALNYVLEEINYGLTDLYVSRTGWASWTDSKYGNTTPTIGTGDSFFVDFDEGIPNDWTTLDVDGDGYGWVSSSDASVYLSGNLVGQGHNASQAFAVSGSYTNITNGVLYPNNYLISPLVKINSTLTFWACAQDASYAAEHFGVAVSIDGNTNPANFTMIQEWTMTAKGGAPKRTRGGDRSQGTWYQYSVDLSSYAGQYGYIAFRHFNCYDQFLLNIDDVEIGNGSNKSNRHFNNYHVMLTDTEDNVIYQTTQTDCYLQLPVENLVDGERYRLKVSADYSSGLGDWKVIEWAYQSCDNFKGVTELNMEMNEDANVISWSYPSVEERSIMSGIYPAYACRLYNGDNSNNPNGWYSFELDNPGTNNLISTVPYVFGGDYCPLDGYVHATYNDNNWYIISAETGEILDQGSLGIYFRDCAWDYSTDMMYGISGDYLYSWNVETNITTQIGYIGFTGQILACDIEGQLWSINSGNANLYKIDKDTGASTYVGSTGMYSYYVQSGGFDHYSGKLYWTGYGDYGYFAEVDTQTGAATVLLENTGEQLSFCVPYNGSDYMSPVTGVLGALLYRDGELLGFTAENSYTDTIATGNHKYEIRVVYDGRRRDPNFNAYYAMSCPTSIGGESYDVTVTAVPTVGGTVTGSGTYINGFPCTVIATEADGFVFTGWTVNGQVVATTPEYTFRVTDNVTVEGNFMGFTPHWTVIDNPNYESTSLIGVVQINGVEQGANYIEVAAFSSGECRGRQMMTYYPEQNRYLIYMTIYGVDNEQITFNLYDHMFGQETEFVCLNKLTFITNEVYGSTTDPFIIDFGIIQETAMQIGWNWYASAVDVDGGEALDMLENSLGADGVMIKSQTEGFVMNYENNWVGNLNALSNNQMYMIKTEAQVNATIAGYLPYVTNYNITIYPGWTWLGYPNYNAMDINDALADFTAQDGDIIKAKQSFSSYVEDQGWIGTLQTLNPGEGMMYYSTRSVSTTLTYSDQGNRQELSPNITAEHNHWVPNAFEYPDNMSIMAIVEIDGVEVSEGDYELAAFDGDKCVGSARMIYVEPMNRYVSFLTISGEEGSVLQFGLFDGNIGVENFNNDDIVMFEHDAILGSIEQPYVVSFRGLTGVSENYKAPHIYPNPVSRGKQFRIDIASSKADYMIIEIVNALGNTVSVNQSSHMPVMVTAPSAAGVYMIKIYVDGTETYCRKLIVK